MKYAVAVLIPGLTFFSLGRPGAAFFCLFLQITLFGWFAATLWAVYTLAQIETGESA